MEQLLNNIKSDFEAVRSYLTDLRMVINSDKTQLMILFPTDENKQLSIELDGAKIVNQSSIKILGLTLAANLRFDEYVWRRKTLLVKRIQYKTSMVRTLKSFLPPQLVFQIGNSLINSTIQYGAALWGATSSSDGNKMKVQKVQTRVSTDPVFLLVGAF